MAEQSDDVLIRLRNVAREFVAERNWDQFHTPKNLAVSLSVEAAELLESFQWLVTGDKQELGDRKLEHVSHEVADVFVYLMRLADKLDIDLEQAVLVKMDINRKKYPAHVVRGDMRKYDEY